MKDPGTGTAYNIDFNKLSTAIDQNWAQNNSGNMLLLEGQGSGSSLAQSNLANISTADDSGSIGSAGDKARGGRESS